MMQLHQRIVPLATPGSLVLTCVLCAFLCAPSLVAQQRVEFIDLPDQAVPANPIMEHVGRAVGALGTAVDTRIPDSFVIRNDHGHVDYDSEKRIITYTAGSSPIYLRTGEGQEIFASHLTADMQNEVAILDGPLVIYQGDTLMHAEEGTYDWKNAVANVTRIRAKANGTIIRGSSAEYTKTSAGKTRITVHHAFVTTEDVGKPSMWVGTGTLTVYPGDYGTVSRLSISGPDRDMTIPILGWLPLSHSLNPDEGYMLIPGVKSIWGTYLLNRYGILLGNRRVEHGMPTADYILTPRVDFRSRRGLAGGIDFISNEMHKEYLDSRGLRIYGIADDRPDINPLSVSREEISHRRYRVAMQSFWDVSPHAARRDSARWILATDLNLLSDRYVLQDYFEEDARLNDKPDNSVRLERYTPRSSAAFLTRFAPNDFYSTDERAELSYYRPRTVLGSSGITYETRNVAGLLHQNIPAEQRELYRTKLSRIRSDEEELKEYYTRLLNSGSYVRINSTHEFTTSVKVLRFLNVTPKVGGGYTGYYNVEDVGADNRLMGYLGCDFDIKFYRQFPTVRLPRLGVNGLYHVIHPYAEISHGSLSSSNPYVPQMDTWSTTLGNSTVCPMPMDLMEFTGIDGWANWTVWRLGMRNVLSTVYDGESRTLIDWNLFLDYNIDNPNTETRFSNLYSLIVLNVTNQCSLRIETQTPTVCGGDGFNQYNTSLSFVPFPWMEAQVGHRYINNHPIQRDANYAYFRVNLRLNERYSATARVSWDVQGDRVPIQQFSITRKFGPWYLGTTVIIRDNGGKHETGVGLSFTLGELGASLPVNLF